MNGRDPWSTVCHLYSHVWLVWLVPFTPHRGPPFGLWAHSPAASSSQLPLLQRRALSWWEALPGRLCVLPTPEAACNLQWWEFFTQIMIFIHVAQCISRIDYSFSVLSKIFLWVDISTFVYPYPPSGLWLFQFSFPLFLLRKTKNSCYEHSCKNVQGFH